MKLKIYSGIVRTLRSVPVIFSYLKQSEKLTVMIDQSIWYQMIGVYGNRRDIWKQ